jgi:hypothetical protein
MKPVAFDVFETISNKPFQVNGRHIIQSEKDVEKP